MDIINGFAVSYLSELINSKYWVAFLKNDSTNLSAPHFNGVCPIIELQRINFNGCNSSRKLLGVKIPWHLCCRHSRLAVNNNKFTAAEFGVVCHVLIDVKHNSQNVGLARVLIMISEPFDQDLLEQTNGKFINTHN